jgi:hypothetical protein
MQPHAVRVLTDLREWVGEEVGAATGVERLPVAAAA